MLFSTRCKFLVLVAFAGHPETAETASSNSSGTCCLKSFQHSVLSGYWIEHVRLEKLVLSNWSISASHEHAFVDWWLFHLERGEE